MTTDAERRTLLEIARAAITAEVTGEPSSPQPAAAGGLARRGGAFVTIHTHGELRGCIGNIEGHGPLATTVADCARSAAARDPRFPPVTRGELPDLDVELSILGPLERVTSAEDIEIGRHGLLVESGYRRGLLLPQVATEHHFDRQTFIEHTCRKAGLPSNAWPGNATLWRFEAEVFSDRST